MPNARAQNTAMHVPGLSILYLSSDIHNADLLQLQNKVSQMIIFLEKIHSVDKLKVLYCCNDMN